MNGEVFCFVHTLYSAEKLIQQTAQEEFAEMSKADADGWTIHNLSFSEDKLKATITCQKLGRVSWTNGVPEVVLTFEAKKMQYACVQVTTVPIEEPVASTSREASPQVPLLEVTDAVSDE